MDGERKSKRSHVRDEAIIKGFASKLKQLRTEAKWSQQRLADEAGIEQSLIGNWETEKGNPTISALAAIARALKVPAYELLKFPDESGS